MDIGQNRNSGVPISDWHLYQPRRVERPTPTIYHRTLSFPPRLPPTLAQAAAAPVKSLLEGQNCATAAGTTGHPSGTTSSSLQQNEVTNQQEVVMTRGKLSLELLNVQSILPKLPDLRVDICDRSPDILCLTETNLKSATPNRMVTIPGYSMFRQDRKLGRKKSGGGVVIFIKEHLTASKIAIKSTETNSLVEILWIKIKIDKKKVAHLACVYRPSSISLTQIHSNFNDLEDQIQQILTACPSNRIIIAGDLNADLHTNPAAHDRMNELERYGFKCVVDEPTFFRNDTQSKLDVVLVSETMCSDRSPVTCSVQKCDYTSHHRSVRIQMTVPRAKQKTQYRTGRNWRAFNSDAFLRAIKEVDWHSIVKRDETCQQQWQAFSTTFNMILDLHAPIRKFKIFNPRPPPVSIETLDLMKERRRARNNNDITYHEINRLTKQAIRPECREDIARRVNNSSPSSLFRQLKHIIATKQGPTKAPENLTPDNLNTYFTTIGINTRDEVVAEFEASRQQELPIRLTRVNNGAMRLTPITLSELRRVLFSFSNKDSSIDGDILIRILKVAFEIIGRHILQIINKSIVSETVPPAWKRAIVIPLFKRDDPTKESNFRPITKVPAICKVVEKIVHKQLTNYLESQHLLSDDQHGFRKGHSTCTALLTITDEILRGMDQSQVTLLTLIYLSRCFDVIDHQKLLNKLELMQISPGWFKSYLEGHMQQVKVGDELSRPLPITIGTFQGTCLGPLLFNIASNDIGCHIPSKINDFKVTMVRYADDTQIALTGPREKIADIQRSMEGLLKVICTWFQQNGMKVNAAKTEVILCGDRRQLPNTSVPPVISVMGQHVQSSKYVRNLGVFFDNTLSWNYHIKMMTERCFGILIGLNQAKHVLPLEILPRIIDSIVFSHIRYCIQVYSSASSTVLKNIQKNLEVRCTYYIRT